jgi:GT2 family glycosyltransferase
MPLSLGVVIPFHNNARRLEWILDALTPQLRHSDEVIVVDDHSDRPPAPPRDMRRVRLASLERISGAGNRAAARNEGWRGCDRDVVVFLDGDMVPCPTFLESLRRLHSEHRGTVVKPARFALTRAEQARGKMSCLQDVASGARWFSARRSQAGETCRPTPHWYYAASNALSVERRYVEQIGGWDEAYQGWGEEDMDFAFRLYRAGLAFVFPESQRLYAVHLDHHVAEDWTESLERNARRFVGKFQEVYEVRLPAYQACGLALARKSGTPPPRVRPNRLLAYSRGTSWR